MLIHQYRGMKMKSVFFSSLLFVSLSIQANERSELENEASEILGFKETVNYYFLGYRKKLSELYPSLTEEYFESNYGLVFKYGQERYMKSYIKGLSVYSDEELRKLINYYKSDEGKWIIKKNLESNAIVLDDLKKASDDFNKVFIERMQSLK